MKSSMTFIQSNGWTEIDLILKQIWRRFIWRQVSFKLYFTHYSLSVAARSWPLHFTFLTRWCRFLEGFKPTPKKVRFIAKLYSLVLPELCLLSLHPVVRLFDIPKYKIFLQEIQHMLHFKDVYIRFSLSGGASEGTNAGVGLNFELQTPPPGTGGHCITTHHTDKIKTPRSLFHVELWPKVLIPRWIVTPSHDSTFNCDPGFGS